MREKADTDLGWFKLSDDLAQALARADLSANEYAICWWVLCHTYAVRKRAEEGHFVARKYTPYTARQIARDTGRDHRGVTRSLYDLLGPERAVLRIGDRQEIGFNTRIGTWATGLIRGEEVGWEPGTGVPTRGQASPGGAGTGVPTKGDRRPHKRGQASPASAPGSLYVERAGARARGEGEESKEPLPLSGAEKSGDLEATFTQAWKVYPRQQGRGSAFRAWRRLKPTIELAATIIGAIKAQRISKKWTEDSGRWVPKMAKWLRDQGWEDAAPATPSDAPKTRRCERCKTSPVHGDQRFCVGDCSLCSQCRDVYEDLKPVGSLYLCKNCRKEKS